MRSYPAARWWGDTYRGPFDDLAAQRGVEHRVIPWTEVGEEEGTAIVHIAPGAGPEDFALGKEHGLADGRPARRERLLRGRLRLAHGRKRVRRA